MLHLSRFNINGETLNTAETSPHVLHCMQSETNNVVHGFMHGFYVKKIINLPQLVQNVLCICKNMVAANCSNSIVSTQTLYTHGINSIHTKHPRLQHVSSMKDYIIIKILYML